MNVKTVATALIAVLLLAACGNKGPLVMPQKPVPVEEQVVPTPEPPADAHSGHGADEHANGNG